MSPLTAHGISLPTAAENDFGSLRSRSAGAVIALDGAQQLALVSPEVKALPGLQALASGQPATSLPPALRRLVTEIFSGKSAPEESEIELPAATGKPRPVWVRSVVATDAAGAVTQVILLLDSQTAGRRLELNLRRLDRLANIGTLSASMAHEVKNALVAVRTFVDLLLEKNQDAELATIVHRELKRIDGLVSQMLRVAGPPRPNHAPVRMHEALNHALRLVQHQLDEKLITLKKSFAATTDHVAGDLYQLEQAFMNLLLNAVEAMGTNGHLTVSTDCLAPVGGHPAQFRLTIQDTGVGIPPENMGRLFETFFTTKKNGTGLGLPITRRIIEEHRGTITVASEPDRGSTFLVLLPLSAAPKD